MITITLSNEPNILSPVNADLWFRLNSASSGLTNFKYLFNPITNVEPYTATNTVLSTYRIPPRPDGYGIFSPHRPLKSYLINNVKPFITGFTISEATLNNYNIRYGFEYDPGLTFSDTFTSSSYLGLTFSTLHDFEVGDLIIVDKTNKTFNSGYDGTCSVTNIVGSYSIRTDKTYDTTSILTNESGLITSLKRFTGTSSTLYYYNGTRQYDERATDFTNVYTLNSTTSKFLTSHNITYKKIDTNDYETLNMFLPVKSMTYSMILNTYNSAGSVLNTYTYSIYPVNSYRSLFFGVGPLNFGLSFSGVDNYSVVLKSYTYSTISETKYYRIDDSCSIYDKVRLCFLNRQGGWDYFSFTQDSKKQVAIERTEYEKVLDWDYEIGDRGSTILSQKTEVTYTINSNWITEKECIFLEQLFTSPEVYIISGSNKYPIIILDKSYEVKTLLRNKIFNMIVNYKLAYNQNLQNE